MIVDVHCHVFYAGTKAEDVVAYLDRYGIDKAVLLPLETLDQPADEVMPTEEVLREARKFPHRLIPFCHVDPREEGATKRVEAYAKRGCKGYGEHKIEELPINHPACLEVYRACADLGFPVLFHLGFGGLKEDLDAYERVLESFPNVNFIAHGPGWWRHLSKEAGDDPYPSGPVREEGRVAQILSSYPNAYADLSAHSGLNALRRDEDYSREFLSRFKNKLIFGTDYWKREEGTLHAGPLLRLLRRLLPDEEAFEEVTSGNLRRLLRGLSFTPPESSPPR